MPMSDCLDHVGQRLEERRAHSGRRVNEPVDAGQKCVEAMRVRLGQLFWRPWHVDSREAAYRRPLIEEMSASWLLGSIVHRLDGAELVVVVHGMLIEILLLLLLLLAPTKTGVPSTSSSYPVAAPTLAHLSCQDELRLGALRSLELLLGLTEAALRSNYLRAVPDLSCWTSRRAVRGDHILVRERGVGAGEGLERKRGGEALELGVAVPAREAGRARVVARVGLEERGAAREEEA